MVWVLLDVGWMLLTNRACRRATLKPQGVIRELNELVMLFVLINQVRWKHMDQSLSDTTTAEYCLVGGR